MNNPNMFPMQPMAQQMAQQGRYGDSMMVHMNPIEVAGIASLSPTGQLTTNPMTGQPEAFLPALLLGGLSALGGGALGGALATGLGFGTGLMGTLGSLGLKGIATEGIRAIASGEDFDPTKALTSAVTSFGVDQAVKSGAEAVKGLAGLEDAATQAQKLADVAAKTGVEQGLTAEAIAQNPFVEAAGTAREGADLVAQEAAKMSALDVVKQGGAMDIAKGFLSPAAAAPIAIGEGQRAAIEAQDERDRMFGRRSAEKEQDLRDAQGIVDASIRQAGSDYGIDYSKEYGTDYGTRYAAQGGITSINPDDFQRRHAELQMMGRQPIQMNGGGPGEIRGINLGNVGTMGGFGAPAGRQSRLRGPEVIKPEELVGTRPGFQPEISYFRKPTEAEAASSLEKVTGVNTAVTPIDPALYQGIGAVGKGGGMGGMSMPIPKEVRDAQKVLEGRAPKKMASKKRIEAQNIVDAYDAGEYGNYYDSIEENVYGMQEGGDTTGQMDQSAAMMLIEQVSMALLGRLPEEQAEIVINRFIDEFGSEAFQMLRSQVLESVVPNSQKEGVIQGEGKGMDDQVPGMIGDQQPVAVSPGEFIVPADVVSGIGDGDTNSGVQELEGMMDRVRQDRTGTMQQPAPLGAKAGGALPA